MGRWTRYNNSRVSTSTTNSNVTHGRRSALAQPTTSQNLNVKTSQQHPAVRFFGNLGAGIHNTLRSYNVFDRVENTRDRSLQDLYMEGVMTGDYDEAWGETVRRAEEEPGKLVGEVATEIGVNVATMGAGLAIKGAVTGIKAGKIGAKVYSKSFLNKADRGYERYNLIRNRHAEPAQRFVKKGKVHTINKDGSVSTKRAGISDLTENQLQRITRRFTKNKRDTLGHDTPKIAGGSDIKLTSKDIKAENILDEIAFKGGKGNIEERVIPGFDDDIRAANIADDIVRSKSERAGDISYGNIYNQRISNERLNLVISDNVKIIKKEPLFGQGAIIERRASKKSFGLKDNEAMTNTEGSLERSFMSEMDNVGEGIEGAIQTGIKTQVDVFPTSVDFVTRSITRSARAVAQKGGTEKQIEAAIKKDIEWFKDTAIKQKDKNLLDIMGQMKAKTTQSSNIKFTRGRLNIGTNVGLDALPSDEKFILEGLSGSRVKQLEKTIKSGKIWDAKSDEYVKIKPEQIQEIKKAIVDIKSGKVFGPDRLDISGVRYGSSGSSAYPLTRVRQLKNEISNREAWDQVLRKDVRLTSGQIAKRKKEITDINKASTQKTFDRAQRESVGNWSKVDGSGMNIGPTADKPYLTLKTFQGAGSKNVATSTTENIGRYSNFLLSEGWRNMVEKKLLPGDIIDSFPRTLSGYLKRENITPQEGADIMYRLKISLKTDFTDDMIKFIVGGNKKPTQTGWIPKRTYRDRMVYDSIVPDKKYYMESVDDMHYLGSSKKVITSTIKTNIKKTKDISAKEKLQANIFRTSRGIFGTSRVQGSKTGYRAPSQSKLIVGQRDPRFDVGHTERVIARDWEMKSIRKLRKQVKPKPSKVDNFNFEDLLSGKKKKVKFGGGGWGGWGS